MSMTEVDQSFSVKRSPWYNLVLDLFIIVALAMAAFLRLRGSDWGQLQHQHPDEGFLTSVTYDLGLLGNSNDTYPLPNTQNSPWRADNPLLFPDCSHWGGYFDTACSPLNPNNRGKSFYTYGSLPVIVTRYLAESTHQMTNLKLFGRQMSAVMDLLTVLLIYIIASRLYDRRVGLLAALFSSLAVMQIQQSHFYTTDLFSNFFIFLAILFAAEILRVPRTQVNSEVEGSADNLQITLVHLARERDVWLSALFGLAYGLAVASKLTAAPLALLLPLAFFIKYFRKGKTAASEAAVIPWNRILVFLVVGGMAAILSFRVFQPYAFVGFRLNPQWLSNIREQRAQATPDSDLPWNLQWANRGHSYSFKNLTEWGLGLPLGLLAWAGFFWMGWRSIKGDWRKHLLLWSWTAAYFGWQSLQYNPTMRYELPIYPLLAMMAGWLLVTMWDHRTDEAAKSRVRNLSRIARPASLVIGLAGLLMTAGWALAFSGIYTRDEPRIAASKWIYQHVPGPVTLLIQQADGSILQQPLPVSVGNQVTSAAPLELNFTALADGKLQEMLLPHVLDSSASGKQTLNLSISSGPALQGVLVAGSLQADFASGDPTQGNAYTVRFESPLQMTKGQNFFIHIETSGGTITLGGGAVVNETDYDYGLPFRTDGFDGFGGLYRGDLNLQVYWDDNPDKLNRFISVLDSADYIFIPTNHQYGQITRLPERYPLTTAYYRALLGCPDDKEIIWCYRVAEPGMFKGKLGFELEAVFTSYPQLGPISINDQQAEEAFTFYDHPKVLIFKKTQGFDPLKLENILKSVDISNAIHLTPGQAQGFKDLMLSPSQLAVQQSGGTWSELFNRQALLNRLPYLGLVAWYLLLLMLGWLAYPIVRAALPGLSDRGYPLARTVGLLLWAWMSWLAGSIGLSYSRLTIVIVLVLIAAAGIWLGIRQWAEIKAELRSKWRYFLMVEMVFLLFFLLDLGIRLGNPDLWHPYKGGERPMDFSYFNAILKSTRFPPYDPWYAGGYINYYYFGFVIVGTPVKLLGIMPSIAYNFILPTWFALLAINAFSVGWNLMETSPAGVQQDWKGIVRRLPFITGLAAALAMVVAGNLGTIRMIYQGLQQLAAPNGVIDPASILQRMEWAAQGLMQVLKGATLSFRPGDWYWLPSRVIPAQGDVEPITEFPLFTFLYSDLHAHMIVLPLTVLVIAWALSILSARGRWTGRLATVLGIGLGALVIGALKPTNTWDYYTYLVVGCLATGYALWRNPPWKTGWQRFPAKTMRWAVLAMAVLSPAILSALFFEPWSKWFYQAYHSVELWKYSHTPVSSYLTQFGVFLFFIVSWMTWETRQWLAETRMSALDKLKPYRGFIEGALFMLVACVFLLLVLKVSIAWLVLPLAAWAAVLILRPGLPDTKRAVLFMTGTGLVLTLAVELVVLKGDIGRMNTVFKFYLQAWVLFGLSAAASFGWLLTEIPKWKPTWQSAWIFICSGLILCASLFLLLGGMDKIRDRWVKEVPHTLDSMAYMAYAHYADFGVDMDLKQDYLAIRWMQDNIKGSPVIVEANVPEYRWGTRFTIYTGLPGVVGWNWHQRQQRALEANTVFARVDEIANFYKTADINSAMTFLNKYKVRYIIVGQLERAEYQEAETGNAGLVKFETYNTVLWDAVYREGQTVIYAVKGY